MTETVITVARIADAVKQPSRFLFRILMPSKKKDCHAVYNHDLKNVAKYNATQVG